MARNISRNTRERCVNARIQRRGVTRQDYFTLKHYGSWTKAERAARIWLRKQRKELGTPTPRKGRMSSRNSSGYVGVHRARTSAKLDGGETETYFRWVARWPECHNRGGVSWAEGKYGPEDAYVLAVISRELESENRQRVIKEVNAIRESPEYAKILAKRPKYAG